MSSIELSSTKTDEHFFLLVMWLQKICLFFLATVLDSTGFQPCEGGPSAGRQSAGERVAHVSARRRGEVGACRGVRGKSRCVVSRIP